MSGDNMRVWNEVCQTDPEYTKKVDFGLKFTSVDAYYLLKRATQIFGPAGHEWGWKIIEIKYSQTVVVVHANIWFADGGEFSTIGSAKMFPYKDKNKEDEEATKKALTNSICKGLSYLGFSADVYEGKFDDDKYVQAMREKTERAAAVNVDEMGTPEEIKEQVLGDMRLTKSYKQATNIWNEYRQPLRFLEKTHPEDYRFIVNEFGKFTEQFDDHPVKGKS